jgi:integrase
MSSRNYSSEPRFELLFASLFVERGGNLMNCAFRRFAVERAESARVVVPLDFHRFRSDFLSRLYDIESGERS